jgi:predicted metalloprotease
MAQQSQLSEEHLNKSAEFVSLVLGDTEATWKKIFRDELIDLLVARAIERPDGSASLAASRLYGSCEQHELRIDIDLDFLNDLRGSLGASGDFAQAYVITHEVGHHVQNLRGTLQYVDTMSRKASEVEANQLSVALELQADCYAGIWANRASHQNLILESGDLEEGLNAASAVGDDRLQKQSQGCVVPDSFTHGTIRPTRGMV